MNTDMWVCEKMMSLEPQYGTMNMDMWVYTCICALNNVSQYYATMQYYEHRHVGIYVSK